MGGTDTGKGPLPSVFFVDSVSESMAGRFCLGWALLLAGFESAVRVVREFIADQQQPAGGRKGGNQAKNTAKDWIYQPLRASPLVRGGVIVRIRGD